MSALRTAGLIGAGMAIGAFTADAGPPPLDALLDVFIWLFYGVVASTGAFSAVSAVLAWRHVRESPRWLWGTLIGLLLLSLPILSSFIRETREMQRLVATADSTGGVVTNKYVRGGVYLVVEYQAGGQLYRVRKRGANPIIGTPAFSRWQRGDSIPVYYQPTAPEAVLVGHRGPDRRVLFESLAKAWGLWGLLLTAYLPLIVRGLRRRLIVVRTRLQSART